MMNFGGKEEGALSLPDDVDIFDVPAKQKVLAAR